MNYPLASDDERDSYRGEEGWKGKIVWMTPEKFLSLAAPLPDNLIDQKSAENLKHRFANNLPTDPLVLNVDMKTRKVTGHEGRHRAKVCIKMGIEKVPVLIYTGGSYTRVPKWSPEQHRDVEDIDSFQKESVGFKEFFNLFLENKQTLLLEEYGSLYHATSLQAFWSIMYDDLFELSYARGNTEQKLTNKPFFASFSRVPANRFRRGSMVTLVINADALKQKYKIKPVDYWQWGPQSSESEERLVSDKPEIKGFKQYITSTHILFRDDVAFRLYENLKYFGSEIYIYTDRDAYFLLNTKKAKSPKEFFKDLPEKEQSPAYTSMSGERTINKMDELLEFLENGGKNRIKPWYDRLMYYPSDFISQVDAEVHNFRSQKGIAVRKIWLRWEALLKEYKANTITQFAQAFLDKHGYKSNK